MEYVPPQSQTTRGNATAGPAPLSPIASPATSSNQRAISTGRDPTSQSTGATAAATAAWSKPLPKDPPVDLDSSRVMGSTAPERSQGKYYQQNRDTLSSVPGLTRDFAFNDQGAFTQSARPTTGGSIASNGASKIDGRLPSRGSYSQPAAPAVAATNAQGRLAQPKGSRKQYRISAPIPHQPGHVPESIGRPSMQHVPPANTGSPAQDQSKGHKRSSTVTSIGEKLFGRSGSIFGGRASNPNSPRQRSGKRYPPTSMKDPFVSDEPRASMDSRRSISNAFHRRGDTASESKPRRFSLIPPNFSIKTFGPSGKDQAPTTETNVTPVSNFFHSSGNQDHEQRRLSTAPGSAPSQHYDQSAGYDGQTPVIHQNEQQYANREDYATQIDQQFAMLHSTPHGQFQNYQQPTRSQTTDVGYPVEANLQSDEFYAHQTQSDYHEQFMPSYPEGFNPIYENGSRHSIQTGRSARGSNVLQKNNRRFADAYEYEKDGSHHSGSSGAARKVMDFFRRRGKARTGDDR